MSFKITWKKYMTLIHGLTCLTFDWSVNACMLGVVIVWLYVIFDCMIYLIFHEDLWFLNKTWWHIIKSIFQNNIETLDQHQVSFQKISPFFTIESKRFPIRSNHFSFIKFKSRSTSSACSESNVILNPFFLTNVKEKERWSLTFWWNPRMIGVEAHVWG